MANFGKFSVDLGNARIELHDKLALTGSEISYNSLPAGVALPFVHKHKQNEEVYLIVKGSGEFSVDGEVFAVKEGDCVRVDPNGERCIKAAQDGLAYFCLQTKANSLEQFTKDDGVICQDSKAF